MALDANDLFILLPDLPPSSFRRTSGERRSNSKVALLCICVSLLAFIITFLSGVNNRSEAQESSAQTNLIPDSDQHIDADRGSCSAVAALLHFSLLATFTWNGVYGTQLVVLVRTMTLSLPSYSTAVSVAVGWGESGLGSGLGCGQNRRSLS